MEEEEEGEGEEFGARFICETVVSFISCENLQLHPSGRASGRQTTVVRIVIASAAAAAAVRCLLHFANREFLHLRRGRDISNFDDDIRFAHLV